MAKLTYVYRNDEVNCIKVSKRQLPLIGGDNLMMLMDLNSKGLVYDHPLVKGVELENFTKKYKLLSPTDLKTCLHVSSEEFSAVLSQNVPCVGCRRSVERLFYQLMLSGHPTLDPIVITEKGFITIDDDKMKSPQSVCTLFSKHKTLLDGLLETQFRNRKNTRCNLHSMDSFRSRPFSETWRDVWNCMKQQCKDEIAVIDASELQLTLDTYLKKHKFCQECRTKVEKAYCLLVSDSNPVKEKGYAAHLYAGIKRCLSDKHIHLQTKLEYIDSLIKRAEPELSGRNSKHRERHAKTLEVAQEEVLTCIGMCLYERLRRISVCLREEESACQVLAGIAVHALCRSFDMAVESKQGISNLELLYEEIIREERCKEQKKEQKKLKKRKKRNEKKHLDIENISSECCCTSSDDLKPNHDDDDDDENNSDHLMLCDGTIIDAPPKLLKELQNCKSRKPVLTADLITNGCKSCNDGTSITRMCAQSSIDAGYSSETANTTSSQQSSISDSRTSSLVSTPEGSEVACADGFCNHDAISSHQKEEKLSPYTHPRFTMTLQEMLDNSLTDDEDGEVDFIPDELILEFKSRSSIVQQQREALRQQLVNNFKRLCINYCKETT